MQGKNSVFSDLLKLVSRQRFDEIVETHQGNKWCKRFFCWDLFIMLLHGQLSGEMSMRTVELCNHYQAAYLQGMNAKAVSLSTFSDACKVRNPAVFMDVFWHLLSILKRRHMPDKEMNAFIHLIDATPIPLKGRGYEWVKNNYRTAGLKMHTVYDYHLQSPVYFTITDPNVNDITEAKKIPIKKSGIYVFDKGYYDYAWWDKIDKKGGRFVTRLKKGSPFNIINKRKVDGNLLHDWTIQLTSRTGKRFKGLLRHIRVRLSNQKTIAILTNDHNSSAEHIAELYKWRWHIELFFKCLKQNLKIKRFWGRNENAVKLQIITAMIAYVLLRLVQLKSGCIESIQKIRIIIRIKLYEDAVVNDIFKVPDKKPQAQEVRLCL